MKRIWIVWWAFGYGDYIPRLVGVCENEADALKMKYEWSHKLPSVWYDEYTLGVHQLPSEIVASIKHYTDKTVKEK